MTRPITESAVLRDLSEFWRRFKRNKNALAGLIIIVGYIIIAIISPLISPHNPVKQDLNKVILPPSPEHPLGTDQLGRDILSRILWGTRTSLLIGLYAVLLGGFIGVMMGAISGYYGGKVDMIIQRIVDLMLAFPSFLLALALISVLGVGLENVVIAVGVTSIPVFTRLVRASALVIKEQAYIEAAKLMGLSDFKIIINYVLPNSLAPIIVQSTLYMGTAILVAAGLGFLGLGVQPPTPEWGQMLGEASVYIFAAPHMVIFPGLAIFLAVLAFNLVGDGLRDALDPRLRVL